MDLKSRKILLILPNTEELKVDIAAMYLEGDTLDLFAWVS